MDLILRVVNFYKKLIFENRRWIYIILIFFALGVLSGLFTAQTNHDAAKKIIEQYSQSIDKSLKPGFEQTKVIFQRNVFVVVVTSISSIFLGFTALFVAYVNGTILGLFVGFEDIYTRISPWQLFLLLFPHGIFEYFGVFLGLSFGLRLGLNWLRKINKGKRLAVLKLNLKETLWILVLVICILVIAAFIEGFLTANIACLLSKLCING